MRPCAQICPKCACSLQEGPASGKDGYTTLHADAPGDLRGVFEPEPEAELGRLYAGTVSVLSSCLST